MTALETLIRSTYGEILTLANPELTNASRDLIAKASNKKKIPAAYDTIDRDRKGRFDGSACHHELYNINPTGTKILICIRETEGSKYGVRTGYKAVTMDEDGNLMSVWDHSPWPLGKPRIEKATDNHTGGFYYYQSIDEVLEAATNSEIFGEWRDHKKLLILRVEVSGREEQVGWLSNKLCATRIKPVEIVASVI